MEANSPAEQLFFTTVRIDTIDASGNAGSGTGFIVAHRYKDNNYPFVVTNKHVVNGMKKGGITFLKKDGEKPKLGDAFRIENDDFENLWFGHEDDEIDIAICPLAPLEKHINSLDVEIFYKNIGSDLIPSEEDIQKLDALEDIVFIGYPNGIWDSHNYIPVMRKGTTATPLMVDFENQQKFLIDASVFGGSSGSPVFIYNTGTYATKGGATQVGTRLHFVGVVAAVYHRNELNEIVTIPIPTGNKEVAVGKEMIDLGIVFKAKTVIETIEQFVDKNEST